MPEKHCAGSYAINICACNHSNTVDNKSKNPVRILLLILSYIFFYILQVLLDVSSSGPKDDALC